MRYMLLIYGDEAQDIPPGTPEFEKMMADYGAFTAEVEAKGAYKVAKGTKGIASVALAGKPAAVARFEVK